MPRQTAADLVAAEIVDWLDRVSEQVAGALLDSPLAPRVVQPTREQTLDYFAPLFFLPDGSPNPAGRQQVLEQHGADAYEDVALGLVTRMQGEGD